MLTLRTNKPPGGNFAINRDSWQARGLTAWWPLAGNIHEYVRNYPKGLLYGNAALGTTAQGRALMLPGNNPDYLNTKTNGQIGQYGSYLTVSAWAYTDNLSGGGANLRYLVSTEASGAGWVMRQHSDDDKLYFYVSAGGFPNVTSTFTLVLNQWYHFVAVYDRYASDGNRIKLYIDGQLNAQAAGANADLTGSNGPISIGAADIYTDRTWSGAARDVRIYNRPLSSAEIYQLCAPSTRYDLYSLPPLLTRASVAPGLTTIRLNWTDNSEHEDGFSIERKTDAGAFAEIDTVAAGVETYDDGPIDEGHTYTYRVKATSAELGDSEYSNEAAETV